MLRVLAFFTLTRIVKWGLLVAGLSFIFVYCSNKWIIRNTTAQIYSEVEKIPQNKVGLLLGARPGNLYYVNRIKAAVLLYKTGKIKHIVVSGDNHTKDYDEGTAMCNDLKAAGIPDSCISIDYAGFRTLDSVVRCDKIFGQQQFTIISQQFHNERALFIANKKGYTCVSFNAEDVPAKFSTATTIREYFARAKCILDIYVFKTQPKFLGEPVIIR